MAAGALPLGVAIFSAVKLAGYSLAGRTLNRVNNVSHPKPLVFGAARTLLGLVAGISYAIVVQKLGIERTGAWYYIDLFPVRQLEWTLMLFLFYRHSPRRRWVDSTWGTLWSYALDVPAVVLAWIIPGGFWIC